MANRRDYDIVVDVDAEGDLGHTDLNDDLEFHNSSTPNDPAPQDQQSQKLLPADAPTPLAFDTNPNSSTRGKIQPDQSASFLNPSGGSGARSNNASGKRFLWSISFYQQFFDVDTNQILHRCTAALFPRENFLDVMEGNPDLYGPFWIATTVVVILFLTGTISSYLASEGKGHFAYDFKLLSGAAGLVYGYTLFIPLGMWAVLRWFGSESANLLECWALYGYANLIWVPVALISWSPIPILNYVFVAVGFAISALFLFRNLYPVISATDAKTSRILLIVVVALHAGLAIAIKILFFAHGSPAIKTPTDLPVEAPPAEGETPAPGEGAEALIRMLFRA